MSEEDRQYFKNLKSARAKLQMALENQAVKGLLLGDNEIAALLLATESADSVPISPLSPEEMQPLDDYDED